MARLAGAEARSVLEDVILRGARSGAFTVSPDSLQDVALAALSVWSATHGLTMLAIDKIPRADLSVEEMVSRLLGIVVVGLRQAHAEPTRRRHAARSKDRAGAPPAFPLG
jgi:hypothetical protein